MPCKNPLALCRMQTCAFPLQPVNSNYNEQWNPVTLATLASLHKGHQRLCMAHRCRPNITQTRITAGSSLPLHWTFANPLFSVNGKILIFRVPKTLFLGLCQLLHILTLFSIKAQSRLDTLLPKKKLQHTPDSSHYVHTA